jgi:hypothetical protein
MLMDAGATSYIVKAKTIGVVSKSHLVSDGGVVTQIEMLT